MLFSQWYSSMASVQWLQFNGTVQWLQFNGFSSMASVQWYSSMASVQSKSIKDKENIFELALTVSEILTFEIFNPDKGHD